MRKIVDTAKDIFFIWMCDVYEERADWYAPQTTIDRMIEYGNKNHWMILEIIADNGKRVDYDRETKEFFIEMED